MNNKWSCDITFEDNNSLQRYSFTKHHDSWEELFSDVLTLGKMLDRDLTDILKKSRFFSIQNDPMMVHVSIKEKKAVVEKSKYFEIIFSRVNNELHINAHCNDKPFASFKADDTDFTNVAYNTTTGHLHFQSKNEGELRLRVPPEKAGEAVKAFMLTVADDTFNTTSICWFEKSAANA